MLSLTFKKHKKKAVRKGYIYGFLGIAFLYLSNSQHFASLFFNVDQISIPSNVDYPFSLTINILRIAVMFCLEFGFFFLATL